MEHFGIFVSSASARAETMSEAYSNTRVLGFRLRWCAWGKNKFLFQVRQLGGKWHAKCITNTWVCQFAPRWRAWDKNDVLETKINRFRGLCRLYLHQQIPKYLHQCVWRLGQIRVRNCPNQNQNVTFENRSWCAVGYKRCRIWHEIVP